MRLEAIVTDLGGKILVEASAQKDATLAFLTSLASMESPSDTPEAQAPVLGALADALEDLGYRVRRIPGVRTGGHLLARPVCKRRGGPYQLLLGHCDTVWRVGTLATMPVALEEGRLRGPGVFDMKAGLVQIIVSLRILQRLGLVPRVTPVVVVNSDEEIGSPESARLIRRVARRAIRAYIPEPAMGLEGKIKTARKGAKRYTVLVRGRAAHAGLDPRGGASAILAMAHLIQNLHAMTDLDRGISVNVGVVEGGSRPNVIAANATAEVDVRFLTRADGDEMEERIRNLATAVPGTSLEILGGMAVPALERTPRNRALWRRARAAAEELGIALEEGVAGGGSDGNTTSQFTATLDGLGAVGDGAHAVHEFVFVDRLVERCALLARLLLLDP